MDLRRPAYVSVSLLSIVAIIAGIHEKRPDLSAPGLLSLFLSALMMYQSSKGKDLRIWVVLILDITLVVSLVNVALGLTEYAQFALATPLFVAVGGTILCCMIAYYGIKLDRVMLSVYLLFLTLAVSNVFSCVAFVYYKIYGVADELVANFWLVDEFAFAFVFCVITMIAVNRIIKMKEIRLVQDRDLLVTAS